MADSRKTEIIITCNTQQPQAAVRAMKTELERLNNVYQQLLSAGKGDSAKAKGTLKDIRDLKAAVKEAEQNLNKVTTVMRNLSEASGSQLASALRKVKKEMQRVSSDSPRLGELRNQFNAITKQIKVLNGEFYGTQEQLNQLLKPRNLKKTPLDDLKRAAAQLESEMRQLDRSQAEYINKSKQLQSVRTEINNATSSVQAHGNAWKTTMRNLTTYFGLFQLFSMIQQKLTDIIRLNLKFSDQLADIRKVSGLAQQDIKDLAVNLSKIDTRTTIEELNSIAYAGAKLGIGQYGTEGLEQFVRAANQVNVALKEDLGDEALTALSKITEVMGLLPKMGVEKSMLATGSAMFQLAATSTATSANIIEFAKRLTGMARTAGITTDQLLALGSAADSMYLMPEVASTAFNKFISSLQVKHNLIEKELSITPGTISNLYSAGRAVDAMVLIFERMREKGNMNALQGIFKDLGSDGARLVNVMVTMSKNVDMLKKHLETSKVAFDEATAVTNEYNIQQETANALMERASNIWEKAFVNPDGVDNVRKLAKAWYDTSKILTESAMYIGPFKAAVSAILGIIQLLVVLMPTLLMFFTFKGVYATISAIVSGFISMRTAIIAAQTAQAGLNATMKANIFGIVITALTTIGALLVEMANKTQDADDKVKGFSKSLNDVWQNMAKMQGEAERYYNAINQAVQGTNERTAAIKNFNEKFGRYYDTMLTEKSSAEEIAKAYERVNSALRAKALLEGMQKDMAQNVDNRQQWEVQKLYEYDRMSRGTQFNQYNGEWLKSYVTDAYNAGRGITETITSFAKLVKANSTVAKDAIAKRGSKIPDYYVSEKASGAREKRDLLSSDRLVYAAANYYAQFASRMNMEKRVREKYAPYQKEMDAALADKVPTETPGTLENEAPDKDAAKKAKQARIEQQRAWREELKTTQDQAKAVIDNIKNFYQRQITETLREANAQNWDPADVEIYTDAITARMNDALSQARKGIVGIKNDWTGVLATMQNDIKEKADEVGYNESVSLLNEIRKADLTAIRSNLVKLTSNLGQPLNAATDAIWKNASLNEKANESAAMRQRKAVNDRMLEDNYTAKVNNDYTQSMKRFGFFAMDEAQQALAVKGDDNAAAMLQSRADEIALVLRNARENVREIYTLDTNEDKGRNRLLEILFGADWDKDTSQLKAIFDLVGNDLQVFYDELIKYTDDYTEAQRKAHERSNKLLNFKWERSPYYTANTTAQQQVEAQKSNVSQFSVSVQQRQAAGEKVPTQGVYGNGQFMQSFGDDPEVTMYRLKMEAAAAYYNFLSTHAADAQSIRDAEQQLISSEVQYAQSAAQQIKQRMDELYSLAQPIEDFGSAVGSAFGTMINDAEAGRAAFKAAVGDMINAFMKQTVEMTKEYLKRSIMQKANDKITSKLLKKSASDQLKIETTKQKDVLNVAEEGGAAKQVLNETVETGIKDVTTQIGQETLATQQTQTTQEVATESAKTQANTTMGIASGAAKIIGSLGWWGIPLVAVITALLNGLLSFAMSKVSSLFGGGGSNTADTGPNVKLVSGMLTYDRGNVQAFRGVDDGKSYPVVGNDGRVYAARDAGQLVTGLVKDPITALVNGQPALVAERGPEMVIGRETTAAIMMSRPDILREILRIDRLNSGRGNYQVYDRGNVQQVAVADSPTLSAADVQELRGTLATLSTVLSAMQQKGIAAYVNPYGRNGGVSQLGKAESFLAQNRR